MQVVCSLIIIVSNIHAHFIRWSTVTKIIFMLTVNVTNQLVYSCSFVREPEKRNYSNLIH